MKEVCAFRRFLWLSEQRVRFRYFGSLSVESRIGHERLVRACFSDYDREFALIAEWKQPDAVREISGAARLIKAHEANKAEFASAIGVAWQGMGLGTALLNLLAKTGRAENLGRIIGRILADYTTMV